MATLPTNPKAPILHSLRVDPMAPFYRVYSLLYSLGILALLYHHFTSFLASPSFLSPFLLLADLVLAFMWATAQPYQWRPVRRREFPDRLMDTETRKDLPALDVFICTADPNKEPPMGVVSTALSVMAFDYPPDRLSIYVSDDGGSDVTLFAFMEAAMFARYWLPFCKENELQKRSPEAYLSSCTDGNSDKIKMMYQAMKKKVESALEKGYVSDDLITSSEERKIFKSWKKFTRQDHPSIIQVLLESRTDRDIMGNALPNLIYVSREKSVASPHHFKAGALNVLLRVSKIMTNAPVVLTLDCDMYSDDPQSPLRALCYFLDPALVSELAFVQFPQKYQGLSKNDIYGGELKRIFNVDAPGMDGFGGPGYMGSNCFHSRRALHGIRPSSLSPLDSHGSSSETWARGSLRLDPVMEQAYEVAGCTYEFGTKWGSTIGFRYGSLVEDFYTGYHLRCEGWKSIYCDPERPAFLGDAPKNLNDVLGQSQRWCIGLHEVAFSKYSPLTFGNRKASLLVGLHFAYYAFWGLWCIPIIIYAFLPQLALIYKKRLFPKVSNSWFYLYAYLFLAAYIIDLVDFLLTKGTIHRWWNDQRMWMTRSITSFLFATIQFALNQVGISTLTFNVTSKVMEVEQSIRYDKEIFDFGVASPYFMVLGTTAIVNLSSFLIGIARAIRIEGVFEEMFVQLFLSGFIAANCWPIYEAMFLRKDSGKMPRNVTLISIMLAGFLHFIGYFMFPI